MKTRGERLPARVPAVVCEANDFDDDGGDDWRWGTLRSAGGFLRGNNGAGRKTFALRTPAE
jgi:hypothetical protein